MATQNQINSNFWRIANTDPSGNVIGITVGNITTTGGLSNLGSNTNVIITGGNLGEVLTTDGTGNLSWTSGSGGLANLGVISTNAAGSLGNLSYDNANYILTYVAPDLTLAVVSGSNVVGEVANANYSAYSGVAFSVAGANVTGVVANANYSSYSGVASSANTVAGANVTGVVANANYSSYSGTAFSVSGSNVIGDVAGANHANIADVANTVAGANVTGVVANANYSAYSGIAATANTVAGANVTGVVANANYSAYSGIAATANTVAGANVTGVVANANYAIYSGTAFSVDGANVTGVVANANYSSYSGVASSANSVDGANVTGVVANANYATYSSHLIDSSQPNVTSVGTLVELTVAGNITTANSLLANTITGVNTSVTITAAGVDGNINLQTTGNGVINATNTRIINVVDPQQAQDVATKSYVDGVAQGLNVHEAVAAATGDTLANITGGSVVYYNGPLNDGVGATLTLGVALTTLDGYTLLNLDRILVKSETTQQWNGIYSIDVAGGGTVLTRTSDADNTASFAGGDFVFVVNGTVYGDTGWVLVDPITTFGTDPIVFTQFSGKGTYVAGVGLSLNVNQFFIANTGVTAGSYGDQSNIATFSVDDRGQLTLANTVAVVANAETLTGTTLNGNILYSSLTSVGNLSSLQVGGNITAGNVYANSGTIGANLLTGTLTTGAQPNITSVGNLVNLNVDGNITSGNINGGNVVYANYIAGNGAALSGLNGSNVTGVVANANYSAYSGVAFSVDAANVNGTVANANYSNFSGVAFSVDGSNVVGTVANANYAAYANVAATANTVAGANVTGIVANANYAAYAGNITIAAQPNITSVGTLTSLSVSGNITAGNVSGGNLVSANFLTGTLTTPAQPNITSVGTLTSLTTSGNVTVGGALSMKSAYESITVIAGATGVTNLNWSNSSVFYLTAPAGNITANLQNYETVANTAGTVAIVLVQGVTPYSVTALNINGTAATINWQAGLLPTGNPSRIDAIALNIINNAGTYVALGQLVSFG